MASALSTVSAKAALSAPSTALNNGQGLAPSASRLAPLRPQTVVVKPSAQRVVVAQAQKEESPVSKVGRTLLAGLAAISIAASGVDAAHAVDVKKEAANLLENADRLTNEDSPPRYGPGRGEPIEQSDRISQRAGSGAESNKAAGLTTPKDQIAQTTSGGFRVGKGVQSPRDIFGRNILSQAKDAIGDAASQAKSAAGSVASKAKNLVGQAPDVPDASDVKSAGKKAVNNIKAQISATPDFNLTGKKVQAKVESDIDQVKSQGKGLFANSPNLASPEKIKNQVESVGDKVKAGAKNLVGDAPALSPVEKAQAKLESAGDNIKGAVKGAIGQAPNLPSGGKVQAKVESDIDQVKSQGKGLFSQLPSPPSAGTVQNKVESDINTVKGKAQEATNQGPSLPNLNLPSASDLKTKVGNAIDDVKSNLPQ